jgi:hypothetical protein
MDTLGDCCQQRTSDLTKYLKNQNFGNVENQWPFCPIFMDIDIGIGERALSDGRKEEEGFAGRATEWAATECQ